MLTVASRDCTVRECTAKQLPSASSADTRSWQPQISQWYTGTTVV